MITPKEGVPPPLTEAEATAVSQAEAQVTAEELVPEAFEDKQGFTGEEQQVAGPIGKFVSKLLPGQKMRDALSPEPMKPGIAGNATEAEAAELLNRQTQTGRIVDPARTPQRNISLKYIDDESEIQRQLDDIAEAQGITSDPAMQPQSWAETQLKANEAEIDLKAMFNNDKKLKLPDSAAEIIAMRDLMTESGRELQEMANALLMTDPASGVKTIRGDITPETLMEFRKAVNAHTAIQFKFMGQAKEVGRALNALKMPNDSVAMPMDALLTGSDPANLRQLAVLISDAKNPNDIPGATKAHWAKRTGGMMYEYWINNLLGSPGTHSKNIIGNSMTMMMALPEHYIAMGIGAARRKTVQLLGKTPEERVHLNEVNSMGYGLMQGLSDGITASLDRLKRDMGETGLIDPSHAKMEYFRRPQVTAANMSIDESSIAGRAVDFLGKWYVRLPGRFLEAEDELFRSVGYRMQLNKSSVAQANREGLDPSSPEFYKRVEEIIREPTEDIHADAIQFSRYQTFTNDLVGDVGEAAQIFQRTPMGRFMIPFLRTPVNILKYGMARTPIGWAVPTVMKDLRSGGVAGDLALSRITMGSLISGYMVASSNNYDDNGNYRPKITGAGPSNYKQKKLWAQYGIQPYSWYSESADKYIPYDIVEPFGTVLATMASAVEVLNHTHDPEMKQEVMSSMAVGIAEYTTDKSYMQGVTQMMDLLRGRGVTRVGTNIAANFNPFGTVAMSRVARDMDPTKRETKDVSSAFGTGTGADTWLGQVIATMKSKTPGLSDTLAPRTDVLGVDIPYDEPLFGLHAISPGMASPLKRDKDAKIVQELVTNGIGPRDPKPVIQFQTKYGPVSVDLLNNDAGMDGDKLFYEYRQMVGSERRDALYKTVNNKGYRKLSDPSPERNHQLTRAMDMGIEIATKKLQSKYPKLISSTMKANEVKGETQSRSIPAGVPETKYKPIDYGRPGG